MLQIGSFCLVVVLQVVTSEPPPPHCRSPPPGVSDPIECCDVPNIFKDEDFEECGIDKSNKEKHGPLDCSKHVCLLKKNDLMKDEEKVDMEAVTEYLDNLAETDSDLKEVVEKVKEKCLKADFEPGHVCEATGVIFCSLAVIFVECPNWQDSDNCSKLKNFIEECKSYYSPIL